MALHHKKTPPLCHRSGVCHYFIWNYSPRVANENICLIYFLPLNYQ